MKISVMTLCFSSLLHSRAMTIAELLRFTAALGVEGIELVDELVSEHRSIEEIRTWLDDAHLELSSYDIMCDFTVLDKGQHEKNQAAVREACKRAAALGALRLLLVPARPPEGMSPSLARNLFIEGIRALMPEIQHLGLIPTIGNHGSLGVYYGKCDDVVAIRESVGSGLKLTYDVGNWILVREDPFECLTRVSPWVVHVHMKDWITVPRTQKAAAGRLQLASLLRTVAEPIRHIDFLDRSLTKLAMRAWLRRILPPPDPALIGLDDRHYMGAILGNGIIDHERLIVQLRKLGYEGYLSIEYEGPEDPKVAMRRGVTRIRTILDALCE